jgi:protein disulfide-isomerase
MKKAFLLLLVAILIPFGAAAQTSTWNQDYQKALAESQKSGKPLLIDFSGTDWCPWCMKLDREVFSQDAFKKYAKDNLTLLLVDFPRKKQLSPELRKQNEELAGKFKIEGFPTVVILNSKGETLGVTGYQEGGAQKYVEHLKGIIEGPKKK